jgi:thymidylate kinase
MIVELFGPAGVGKTTFAHALRERLNAKGHTAKVVLSYRPGEEVSALDPGGVMAAVCRIARAIAGTIAIAARPIARKNELSLAFELVRALPPTNVVWFIRLAQYVLRLCHCWTLCSETADIIIFDQAFVQATCTLAVNSCSASDARLEKALTLVPKADLIIRLYAPPEMLKSRLDDRLRRQTFGERFFEAHLEKHLTGFHDFDRVNFLLGNKGISTISLSLHDLSSLGQGLDRAEDEINRAKRPANEPAVAT